MFAVTRVLRCVTGQVWWCHQVVSTQCFWPRIAQLSTAMDMTTPDVVAFAMECLSTARHLQKKFLLLLSRISQFSTTSGLKLKGCNAYVSEGHYCMNVVSHSAVSVIFSVPSLIFCSCWFFLIFFLLLPHHLLMILLIGHSLFVMNCLKRHAKICKEEHLWGACIVRHIIQIAFFFETG